MTAPESFEKLGKYEIVGKIGQGSFGVVYEGRDPYLKRKVAIKVCSLEDQDLRRRFFREAEISGRLQHRNIVTVHDFGVEDDVPYLVQEFLAGEDLEAAIKKRTALTAEQKLAILIQIGEGLEYAHRRGVVHRDIKPGNVRLLPDATVKILDFGIAKLATAETQLTQRGVTLGTASYLPPEQVRGTEVDQRADVFSFGALAFELLSYERPFRGTTLSALVYQILYKVAPPLEEAWPSCPPELSRLVASCLEKKPEARPQSFDEVVSALEAIRERVGAGEWPELRQAALTPAPASRRDDTGSDVLSHTEVAKTAREMEQGHLGEATVSISGRKPGSVPAAPVPAAATGPAPSGAGVVGAESAAADATQPVKMKLPPPPGPPAPGGRPTSLVTELPTAKLPTGEPPPPPPPPSRPAAPPPVAVADASSTAPAPPPAPPASPSPPVTPAPRPASAAIGEGSDSTGLRTLGGSPILADRGREIGTLIAHGQLEEALQQLESTLGEVRSTQGGRPATTPMPQVALDRPLPPPRSATASDAFRTAIRDRRVTWSLVAVAALATLVVAAMLLRDPGPPRLEPAETAVTAPVDPSPAPSGAASGQLVVHAAPWAEITEITDDDGYLQPLPTEVTTPVVLSLPPGSYRLQLTLADGDTAACEAEVGVGAMATCLPGSPAAGGEAPTVDAAAVTGYFKESGWWG